ncbi:MAG: peptidoglycan-associated lipoprotein Pal [Nitrospirota bacterium]
MTSLFGMFWLLALLAACSGVSGSTVAPEPAPPPVVKQEPPPPPPEPPKPEPPKVEERVEEPPPPSPPPPVEQTREAEAQAAAPPAAPVPEPVDVYFDYNKAVLKDDEKGALDAIIEYLKTESGKQVLVEGHCDERGTIEYNLTLGEKRAKAVGRYLEAKGAPSSQIETTSYGKERPVCTEHSVACWKQNRRAHVAVR